MSASENDELVANFATITGVDADRARFYLESAGWNMDLAMGSFYQDDDDDDAMQQDAVAAPESAQPAGATSHDKPKIATLSSMRPESGSDSSDEEGEAFYTGGSERGSGQQILGPPRKKNPEKFVQKMFDSAKEHGAEVVESTAKESKPGKKTKFCGTGYRLGETEDAPTDVVHGAPLQSSAPRQVDMVLKMWKDGFSIDDGQLRDYNDPVNMEFINSIKRGEVPTELTRMARGGEVNLNMEDHRTEQFVRPKVTTRAFTGEGFRLGSAVPPVACLAAETKSAASAAQSAVTVDSSQPSTSVQIRLADGSRLVAKFNHTHTVADIRSYIEAAHSQFAGANYMLMTTFPNKELTDASQTLEQAQLLNSSIVQRMK